MTLRNAPRMSESQAWAPRRLARKAEALSGPGASSEIIIRSFFDNVIMNSAERQT